MTRQLTAIELKAQYEKVVQAERYDKAVFLQETMIAESNGRLNSDNTFIFESGKGDQFSASVFIKDGQGNTLLVVGDMAKWQGLRAFVELMTTPSDAEIERLANSK